MAKNDQQDSYEKLLSANHARMIDFVKFAEAKNAALLTFASVWIGTIITLLRSNSDPLPMGYNTAFLAVLPLLVIAAIISVKSFLPRFLHHFHQTADTRNFLYFEHIASIKTDMLDETMRARYLPSDDNAFTDEYISDLSLQIAIQARIADRKFRAFNRAGWLVLIAFGIMILPIARVLIHLADSFAHAQGWL